MLGIEHVRDAEVGELHHSRFVQKHVLGFHVAMNDALRMGSREPTRQVHTDSDRDLRRNHADSVEEGLERGTGE